MSVFTLLIVVHCSVASKNDYIIGLVAVKLFMFMRDTWGWQVASDMVQKLPVKDERKPTKRGYVFRKFVEFCKRTDLHGFKYIVMEELTMVERICWAVAVFASTIVAVIFVFTAYRWYARNPVVTVIESTQGAIWDVPFPAVTICDINAVSKKAARSLSNNLTLPLHITHDYVFKALKLIPLLFFGANIKEQDKEQLRTLQDVIDLNGISLKSLFTNVSPTSSCDNLIQRCMWKNILYRCDQLFQQVAINIGICCSFNYFAIDDLDSRNADLLQISTPRRVASCGYQTALTVLLNVDVDDYYSSSVASQGMLVFIDNAYNLPDQDSPARMVSPSTEVLIALAPERTYSTSGIKGFTPEQRQCYFHNEMKIANFKYYSFHNCMVFQRILTMKRECDCVPWFFPQNDGYRTCNFRDIDCIETLQERLTIKELVNLPKSAPCLPECEHYDYPLEVAMGKLSNNVPLKGLPFFEDVSIANSSVLNIFFNDLVSTRYRRDVHLNWQNILAAFGGLLSLMLGFTFISGIDFLIFFVFRMIYDCTFGNIFEGKKWKTKRKIINVGEKKNNKSYGDDNDNEWNKYRY